MSAPDFEALRAERNRKYNEFAEEMRAKGWDVSGACIHSNPNRCYCDCASGGPCEHDWSGPMVEFDSGCSASCARCGMTAMTHDLRVMP